MILYTDGSCCGNGKAINKGGFGVVVLDDQQQLVRTYGKQSENTTNNREELKAMLCALEWTQTEFKSCECIIYSDSAYVVNICNEWIWNWCNHGWTRAGNKPIENLDLIQKIYEYLTIPFNNFSIRKVAGHCGVLGNEIADALATNDTAKLAKIFQDNDLGTVSV